MALSVRFAPELAKRLEAVARASGLSKSEVIRRSVKDYLERNENRANVAWEAGKDLFGKFGSGQSDVASNAEHILREAFDAKHRGH